MPIETRVIRSARTGWIPPDGPRSSDQTCLTHPRPPSAPHDGTDGISRDLVRASATVSSRSFAASNRTLMNPLEPTRLGPCTTTDLSGFCRCVLFYVSWCSSEERSASNESAGGTVLTAGCDPSRERSPMGSRTRDPAASRPRTEGELPSERIVRAANPTDTVTHTFDGTRRESPHARCARDTDLLATSLFFAGEPDEEGGGRVASAW